MGTMDLGLNLERAFYGSKFTGLKIPKWVKRGFNKFSKFRNRDYWDALMATGEEWITYDGF